MGPHRHHSCCSSWLALGVRLRTTWLRICSTNSGFCCCICCANCWPLQISRRQTVLPHSSGPPRPGHPPTPAPPLLQDPLAHLWVLSATTTTHHFPATSTSKRSTHAWMRLARSLCCGLLPGVPRGLWPPEIMPDMLQERELSTGHSHGPPPPMIHRQLPVRPQHHAPSFSGSKLSQCVVAMTSTMGSCQEGK